jgi:hypothetical protein
MQIYNMRGIFIVQKLADHRSRVHGIKISILLYLPQKLLIEHAAGSARSLSRECFNAPLTLFFVFSRSLSNYLMSPSIFD